MAKVGTYFAKTKYVDGIRFDSIKEANFYLRYVKTCGWRYEIHKNFNLKPATPVKGIKIQGLRYAPDFVIYNEDGSFKHVYDIKTGFTPSAIQSSANMRFKLFAYKYDQPVEVVVPRTHDFKVKVLNVTTGFEPIICRNVNYDICDYIGR